MDFHIDSKFIQECLKGSTNICSSKKHEYVTDMHVLVWITQKHAADISHLFDKSGVSLADLEKVISTSVAIGRAKEHGFKPDTSLLTKFFAAIYCDASLISGNTINWLHAVAYFSTRAGTLSYNLLQQSGLQTNSLTAEVSKLLSTDSVCSKHVIENYYKRIHDAHLLVDREKEIGSWELVSDEKGGKIMKRGRKSF